MMSAGDRIRLLVVTCVTLFMAMLDNLVIGVALPSIQTSFHAGMSDLQWFMNAYTLAFAVLLIPFSALGERFGRKRMFLIGVVLFTLGSLASALSDSSLLLTLSRALQGVGAAAIMPISLTLVNGAFPPEKGRPRLAFGPASPALGCPSDHWSAERLLRGALAGDLLDQRSDRRAGGPVRDALAEGVEGRTQADRPARHYAARCRLVRIGLRYGPR